MMKIELTKSSEKAISKLPANIQTYIKQRILLLRDKILLSNRIPYDNLDIKRLSGKWDPLLRLRVG